MAPVLARRFAHLPALLLLMALVTRSTSVAELPVRITDLSPGATSSLFALDAAVLAGELFFAATADGGSSYDLWVYDGASPASIVPGGSGVEPEDLTVWEGALYFEGGPFADRELWRYDGVAPPAEVLDLFPTGSGQPHHLTVLGTELCFGAWTSATVGDELVCWNGTAAPVVYELRDGEFGSSFAVPAVIGDRLYFAAYGDGVGSEPWVYESFSPPTLVGDLRPGINGSNPESFVEVGGTLYVRAGDAGGVSRLWSAEGVAPPAILFPTFGVQGELATWHSKLLVVGSEGSGGVAQLHVLRGGSLAPAPWAGGGVFSANHFLEHRNALYFHSGATAPAGDLFRYCGGGTVERVTDLFADASYIGKGLVVFQGRIYFPAWDSVNGRELWAVDPLTAVFCDGFEEGDLAGWLSAP
jgi:ELWxxDGT repeat protein